MVGYTATISEARANFSKIASTVYDTGTSVTVFKNSKPWVMIVPATNANCPVVDWSQGAVPIDPDLGHAVVPNEWDDPADEGLYDDLA